MCVHVIISQYLLCSRKTDIKCRYYVQMLFRVEESEVSAPPLLGSYGHWDHVDPSMLNSVPIDVKKELSRLYF